MYKLLKDKLTQEEVPTTILRKTDNTFIPFDSANTDYQEYLEWLAQGNEPEPADGEEE